MAGRRPKPTALKELAGNPGKRPLNRAEPQPGEAPLRVPRKRLPRDGQRLWEVLAPHLKDLGVLKVTDLPAFEMLCLHYAMVQQAREVVAEEGIIAESRTETPTEYGTKITVVIKKHPAASVLRENSLAFKSYASEFGLTPSSRVKIKTDAGEKEKSLAELLFEGIDDVD